MTVVDWIAVVVLVLALAVLGMTITFMAGHAIGRRGRDDK